MIDLVTVEDALHDWIVAATGIPADHVLWAEQAFERPSDDAPWVALRLESIQRVGQDWYVSSDHPVPVAGAERLLTVNGVRTALLVIQCFRGAATGTSRPQAYLDAAVMGITLPARRAAFLAAGIGIGEIGPIRNIGDVISLTRFEPRAVVEVTLLLAGTTTSTGTYIEQVTLEGTVTN